MNSFFSLQRNERKKQRYIISQLIFIFSSIYNIHCLNGAVLHAQKSDLRWERYKAKTTKKKKRHLIKTRFWKNTELMYRRWITEIKIICIQNKNSNNIILNLSCRTEYINYNNKREPLRKKYGIFWEFFPYGGGGFS